MINVITSSVSAYTSFHQLLLALEFSVFLFKHVSLQEWRPLTQEDVIIYGRISIAIKAMHHIYLKRNLPDVFQAPGGGANSINVCVHT